MTDFHLISQSLLRFIHLDSDELAKFNRHIRVKKLKKKELLLNNGELCKSVYFIHSGCLRYYYLIDGEEKTAQFFFEGAWYTDYDSFLTGNPTENLVDALEETELLYLEKENLFKLYDEIPKIERFGRIMAENAYMGNRYRTKTLTNLSAEERYINLMKERPKVIERIPQYYIASYLNIKPQSLSRIRKNLVEKEKK